jgi:hypothetical protein
MKKLKLADVKRDKKWNISKEDRQRLDNSASVENSSRAMESLAKSMVVSQIEISKDVRELAKAMMKAPPFRVEQLPAPAPVKVTVQADTTKKRHRFKVIRDKDGLIDYVDVEQL